MNWMGSSPPVIFVVSPMQQNMYTAVTKQDGDWWIGWIEEVPGVNCQEQTKEELLKSLNVTLREALEFNREDALRVAVSNYQEELVLV